MPKITILQGLPASGKSTWAKEQILKSHGRTKMVNKDDLRALLDVNKWTRDNEKFVLKVRDSIIGEAMSKGLDVIVDDTNLSPKHISHITVIVEIWNKTGVEAEMLTDGRIKHTQYTVEVNDSFLQVPYKECVKRDLARPNSVGEKVIRGMWLQYIYKAEKLTQNKELPHVIVCDLDGTLCLFGKNNPFERDFSKDICSEPVKQIIRMVCNPVPNMFNGNKIIFLSGRNSKYEKVTIDWIDKNVFDLHESLAGLELEKYKLYMRKEGDSRSDMIVKNEMFEEFIKDKYYVDFILDDRKSVKALWVTKGLFVLDVNQNDEEF